MLSQYLFSLSQTLYRSNLLMLSQCDAVAEFVMCIHRNENFNLNLWFVYQLLKPTFLFFKRWLQNPTKIKGFHRTLHWNVVNGYMYVIIVVVVNDVCESVFTLNFSSLFIYPQIILIKIHFQQQFQTHKQKIKKQKRDSHSKVFFGNLVGKHFSKKPQLIFTSFHKLIFKINPKYFNIFFLFHFVGKIRNKGVKSQETRIYRRKIFWNIILHWER